MNELCFPIGLNIKKDNIVNVLCIKNNFDFHMETRILNKIYNKNQKSNSLKNKKSLKKIKTKKNY